MMQNVLVVCGDRWHPANAVRHGLRPLQAFGFHFEYLENGETISGEILDKFPAAVLARVNVDQESRPCLTPESDGILPEYVRRGNSLLVLHGGLAGYEKLPATNSLIGGSFIRHPELCPVTIEPAGQSAITNSVTPFVALDEHYFVETQSHLKIFLRSRSQYGVQPAGWTREEGRGTVCVLTPGHTPEMWAHPEFQKLLLNALQWRPGGA